MDKTSNIFGLHGRIVTVLLLVSLLPLALVAAGSQIVFSNLLEQKSFELHRSVVEAHARSIDLYLVERLRALEVIAQSQSLEELCTDSVLKQMLETINNSYGNSFIDIGIISDQGRHLAYVGPYALQDKNYSHEEWFLNARSQNSYVSDVFLGFRGIPHCIIAVKRLTDGTSCILRATINSEEFDSIVHPGQIGQTGDAFIVNSAGLYQTPAKSGAVMDSSQIRSPKPHSGVLQNRVAAGGITMLRATTWLNNGRWMLVVQQDENEIQAPVRQAMLRGGLVVVMAVALVAVTTILATRHLTRKIDLANEQREALSKDFLRSAKLASLGEMSSGLAHEINNPLAIISAEHTNIADQISELHAEVQIKKDLFDSINRCIKQVKRCGNITAKMLQFGHKTDTRLQPTDIRTKLEDVFVLMQKQALINNVNLTVDLGHAAALPRVLIDPSEFEQVLVNLINNAIHAIKGQGSITISARQSGRMIDVIVSDTGTGIDPDNMDKIFQPFFTTKAPGEGTGLGLSVCYGIVRGWGGAIEARSAPGQGTDMIIRLPVAKEEVHI